jgi:putative ABC transport system substrate-binding protein
MFTTKRTIILLLSLIAVILSTYFFQKNTQQLPIIAIANYGPHSSLEETIKGFKETLEKFGYKENEQIQFDMNHVNFDPTQIIQMLTKLQSKNPKLLLAITTPVAQSAQNVFKDKPIVFASITDPVEAGLLKNENESTANITGASERQDFNALINFIKSILPNAKRIGMLYATGEANDLALLKSFEHEAEKHNMILVSKAIDHPRDVPLGIASFKDKVDLIYVGTSGPIQPTLPAIVHAADGLGIPIINADSDAVHKNLVLASFGVSFYQIGANAAKIAASIMGGKDIKDIKPIHPNLEDHHGFISKKQTKKFNIQLPKDEKNISILE